MTMNIYTVHIQLRTGDSVAIEVLADNAPEAVRVVYWAIFNKPFPVVFQPKIEGSDYYLNSRCLRLGGIVVTKSQAVMIMPDAVVTIDCSVEQKS